MWSVKKRIKQIGEIGDIEKPADMQDRAARWIADRLIQCRRFTLRNLEQVDRNMNNQQRKCVFYMVVLCWSSLLFYLLGTAVRRPHAPYVLPLVPDSSLVVEQNNAVELPSTINRKRRGAAQKNNYSTFKKQKKCSKMNASVKN